MNPMRRMPQLLHGPQSHSDQCLAGPGVDRFWDAVCEFQALGQANGQIAARRQHQALAWMWERIDAGLKLAFRQNRPVVQARLPEVTRDVEAGRIAASTAARNLLAALKTQRKQLSIQ